MKNARILLLFLLLQALVPEAIAQLLDQRISVQYADASISEVLSGISRGYGTRFAYSSDFVPVSRRVSVTARNEPLRRVLDRIFEDQAVQYADINGQVVLKMDRRQLGQLELPKAKPVQISPLYPQALSREELAALKRQRERWEYMAAIELRRAERLEGGPAGQVVMPQPIPLTPEEDELFHRLAQISLLPLLGTNALRSMEITNNLSLNVLWGVSGGLSGFEIGGFGNTVLGDVTGVQLAGIGNIVGGDIVGTQVSGLFNVGPGRVQGVQAAGLFNVAGDIDAVQASSLFNIATGKMTGVQAAGLFNIAAGGADGFQGSSLFNISNGHTRAQTAALFNVAHDVRNAQVSLLFNRAKRVDGLQFAIVNIADTVAGVPIGLFNFVRKGYNRVEMATTESLYANLGLKFGARSFYNILQAGARWESLRSPTLDGLYWGVGYGFGSTTSLNRRLLLNTELLAMHINEEERWTRPLNLLGQLRFTFDFRVSSRLSFFAGPSANLMLSRRYNPETGQYGSGLPPETIWEGRIGNARGQAWIGFTAGLRV
jgi:hypothetical protein